MIPIDLILNETGKLRDLTIEFFGEERWAYMK